MSTGILYVTVAYSWKISALVLSRRSIGEADRTVTFFTREMGLLRVLAKGVRKIPSRRGGHLEPLTEAAAVISGRPGRYWLTAVETRDYFGALHREAEAVASARVQAWAAMHLLEYEAAYPSVFAALQYSWRHTTALATGRRALLEAAVVLFILRAAGWLPRLGACQRCGQREPLEAVVLDAERGGWLCLSCRLASGELPSWRGAETSLTPQGLACLRLAAVSWTKARQLTISPAEGWQLTAALRAYLGAAAHVQTFVPASSRYG